MKRRREIQNMLLRRLILAWKFRMWPWTLPRGAVKWIALDQRLSPADETRARAFAEKRGL